MDPYVQQDLIERVSDALLEESPRLAILSIMDAYDLDIDDVETARMEVKDA